METASKELTKALDYAYYTTEYLWLSLHASRALPGFMSLRPQTRSSHACIIDAPATLHAVVILKHISHCSLRILACLPHQCVS